MIIKILEKSLIKTKNNLDYWLQVKFKVNKSNKIIWSWKDNWHQKLLRDGTGLLKWFWCKSLMTNRLMFGLWGAALQSLFTAQSLTLNKRILLCILKKGFCFKDNLVFPFLHYSFKKKKVKSKTKNKINYIKL